MPKSRNRRKIAATRTNRKSAPEPPPFRSMESLLASLETDVSAADSPDHRAQTLVYDAWEMPVLSAAMKANSLVPDYLPGRLKLPVAITDHLELGGRAEAQANAAAYRSIRKKGQRGIGLAEESRARRHTLITNRSIPVK